MTYPKFPKIARLYDDVVITEKIDGTNGLIAIERITQPEATPLSGQTFVLSSEGDTLAVRAGSRERWLDPTIKGGDNYGFAQWVAENAESLSLLGEGLHYGEWYGKGIGRGYGLTERRFMSFIPGFTLMVDYKFLVEGPTVLYQGNLRHACIDEIVGLLKVAGSKAIPGYMKPEGIVVHHCRGKFNLKVVIDGNGEKRNG